MNTEQLKMLLDAIQSASGSGKDAFLWWLLADKVLPLFGWLIVFAGFFWIVTCLIRSMISHSKLKELRDALHVGSSGELTPSEFAQTMQKALDLARRDDNRAG